MNTGPLWIPLLTALVGAIVGALAAVAGTLLTSWLITRREQWTAKRDAYVAVLEGFQLTRLAYRRMEVLHEASLPVPNAQALDALHEEVQSKMGPDFKEARDSLYRAGAIARLTLSPRAVAELDRYDYEDAVAATTSGLFERLRARREAVETTFNRLVAIARDELKVGKVPQSS